MSSVRICTRKDGSVYTQILFRELDPAKGRKVQASLSFDDHEAALRWQKILDQVGPESARKILMVEERSEKAAVPTLNSFAPTYIDGLTGVEQAWKDRLHAYMRNDFGPYLGDLPLSALCSADADKNSVVQEWIAASEADGVAGKTIANKHGFLSACLKVAVRRRLMPFNPCEDSKLPPRHYEPCFLEPDEFDILYGAMDVEIQRGRSLKRWKPMVLFLVTSGVRFSECTALTVGDVKVREEDGVRRCSVRVAKAWKYTGTSEGKLGGPKTRKGIRTIDIPIETADKLDLTRPKNRLLFATESETRISAQLFFQSCWSPLRTRVADRINSEPRVHDLRHTCASWMLANGAEIGDVQRHLGHESMKTTTDVYGHFDRRSGMRASTAVSKALVRTAVRRSA